MKKARIFITIIVVLFLGWLFFWLGAAPQKNVSDSQIDAEAIAKVEEDKAAIQASPAAARYSNSKYGFSFEKPEGYTVGALREDAGDTILVQTSANPRSGFQIYITPLDEPLTLTPDVIKADLPGTLVSKPQKINLDGKGSGIMFASNNATFDGKSFEIWFVADNYLYQITSYQNFASELQKIIGTWKFQ